MKVKKKMISHIIRLIMVVFMEVTVMVCLILLSC